MKGRNLRDSDCDPFRNVSDTRLAFLDSVVVWLNNWSELNLKGRHGCLSQKTQFALRHTIVTLIILIKHLLENISHKYVLLSKFQADNLELRFSQYKQMSDGNYNASVRQVMESGIKT